MNGFAPIADMFGHRASQWPGITRLGNSSFTSSNTTNGLSRKVQLLELCARIGYTPQA